MGIQGQRSAAMIVAQISDLHFVDPGLLHLGNDTAAATRAMAEHLNAMDPRPDVVLVTGDIADGGALEQYEAARNVLDLMRPPYYVIPGNHDRRAALKTAFRDHLGEDGNGFVQYAVEGQPLRLVGLDTLSEGEARGRLDAPRLAWLDAALASEPDRLTLVFMHHPPFTTGIEWMDEMGLQDRAGLDAVLRRHPQVRLVVAGHLHRPISGTIGHARVAVAPSATDAVGLSLGGRDGSFGPEPLACLVHILLDGQLVTHVSYVDRATP
jgi:3',5'-cyclic AMP phosphodiesterase CpdA